jgi:hypothetical protein
MPASARKRLSKGAALCGGMDDRCSHASSASLIRFEQIEEGSRNVRAQYRQSGLKGFWWRCDTSGNPRSTTALGPA